MATAVDPASRRADLQTRIDAILAAPALASAVIGVHVVDLATRTVLYTRDANVPLNPASNTKLATTAGALLVLGPEHRYITRLYHDDGALRGGTIEGDLYLQGGGDPNLVTEDLYAMVARLRAQGIQRIRGGIVVDSTAFDRDELPPGFDQKDELAAYRAPSGATSVNFNTFELRARPGATPASPALVGLDPAVSSIKLVNEAKTVEGKRRRLVVDITAEASQVVRLSGDIGTEAQAATYRYPVLDPSLNAGDVLLGLLRVANIKVGKSRIRLGPTPAKVEVLAIHYSDPLSVLIRGVNKFSNNFMAEQVLKTLAPPGEPATFASALTRLRQALEVQGIDLRGAVMGNGSGLYDTNRYSAAQITSILAAMHDDPRYQSDYLASFAIAGIDGTTGHRMQGGPAERWVRVKTGTLNGVSALSGYASARARPPVVFALLFNGLSGGGPGAARRAQDEIATLLARFAAGEPLIEQSP